MIFDFGKHSGDAVEDVVAKDRNYCIWLLKKFKNKKFDAIKKEIDKELSKTEPQPEQENIMPFGKYKGQALKEFAFGDDTSYCKWLLDKESFKKEYPKTYSNLKRLYTLYKNQDGELRYFYVLVFAEKDYVKVGITSNFIAKRIYNYSHTNHHLYNDHNIIYAQSYVFMTNDVMIESKVLEHFHDERVDSRSERLDVSRESVEEYIDKERQKHAQFYYRRKCLKGFFPFKDSKTFRDTFYIKINEFENFRKSYRQYLRQYELLDQYQPGFKEISQFQN